MREGLVAIRNAYLAVAPQWVKRSTKLKSTELAEKHPEVKAFAEVLLSVQRAVDSLIWRHSVALTIATVAGENVRRYSLAQA